MAPELETDHAPERRARKLVPSGAGLLVVALLLFCAYAPAYRPNSWHVQGPFVDQAGYVTSARRWLDEGEPRSGIVFPAQVKQADWRPYMPGHYACLALSYLTLGYGQVASLVPSLCAFLVAAGCVFWIGARRYDARTAGIAASLFVLFPGTQVYAFSAMAESTFSAACVLAFTLLLAMPARWRAPATPFLLVLPFLFRETGALFVLPMAAVAAHGRPRSLRIFSGTLLASVLVLAVVNWTQLASGKGGVPLSWVSQGSYNYNDALPTAGLQASAGAWLEALGTNALRNLRQIGELLRHSPTAFRTTGLLALFAIVAVNLVGGWRRRRSDPLPLACGALGLSVLLLAVFLYDVGAQKGLRNLLFTFPLSLLGACSLLAPRAARFSGRRPAAALLLVSAGFVLHFFWVHQAAALLVADDGRTRQVRTAMAAIDVPEDTLALVPFRLIGDYAVQAYPTRTAFSPANGDTFRLLEELYGIGVWFVPPGKLPQEPPRQLHDGLLRLHKRFTIDGETYLVYRRAPGR